MKVRSNILTSHKAALLGGAILIAMVPATAALAADKMPVKAVPATVEDTAGWYSSGTIEAGSNFFLKKPDNGFGKTSSDPFWLTPTTTDSNAKMDEYGKVPRNVFLSEVGIQAGSKDGRFAMDFWADYAGTNFQRYYLQLFEPGRQYLTLGWDETPHVLGTSAKTIFQNAGSSHLTVDPASRAFLQSQLSGAGSATQSQPQRNNIDDFINGRNAFGGAGFPAPITNIELETQRKKFTAAYRNTMLDNWDFNVDYSNEHRTGTRPLGIGYGYSRTGLTPATSTPGSPRASTGSVEVPQPLDDRTQLVNGAGEYSGTTPWGTRWSTSVKYAGSSYTNDIKSLLVDNPFCITCVAANGAPVPANTQIGPNTLQYGLYPDNTSNAVTWSTAVDLPIWKSRYTSNLQYTAMRQNDAFLNDATNGITTLAAYPAASLGGKVNTFLTNNVLTSHVTKELTNTARVRYYDRKDETPELAFINYVNADNGTATTTPLTREPNSYTKLNIEDELKYQVNRAWTLGAGYFFERFKYENGEVDATNESGVKGYVNWTPYSWLTARSSLQYSQRRYDNWLATSTDPAAQAMRYFFVANRDRTKGSTIIEWQFAKNITISPNGGFRYDEYPSDSVLSGNTASAFVLPTTTSLGTKHDRSWNIGTDVGFRLSPDFKVMVGYNYEEHYLRLESCCGGGAATVPFTAADRWSSDITQKYNTFTGSAAWAAIPGKLDFKADYLVAIANEANLTTPCASGNASCTGNNTPPATTSPFPDEHNIFQRFSFLAKYHFDPSLVKQMGWFGNVSASVRYTWEKNANTNWATDTFSPYSPSAADAGGTDISNGGRSLFLAYNNPNYTAQIITAAINWRW